MNIAIVGSGIGGMAAAIRLAVRGHDVTVFEQSDRPGGMIQQKEWEGYRWDTAAPGLIMPEILEELFLLAGEEMKVSVRCSQLDITSRYFYTDGMVLDAYGDVDSFAKEVQQKTGEPAGKVHRYLNRLRKRYDRTRKVLMRYNVTLKEVLLFPSLIWAYLLAVVNDYFYTAHGVNRRSFKSKHLVQLFDLLASSQGGNPYRTPSTSNFNAHFVHNLGVYYPEKGMYIITKELYQLALQIGVNFRFNEKIKTIEFKNRTVKGILTTESFYKSDIVISDADIHLFYKDLLPEHLPKRYLKQELSSSALMFYWAVDKKFSELSFRNILFSPNPKKEYKCLMEGRVNEHPTIQLNISAKVAERDAPPACENWTIMVPVPVNKGQAWETEANVIRKHVIARINETLNTDIRNHIKKEFISDPISIEKNYAAYKGNIFGSNNNRRLSIFRRHPNFANHIHGLYFVGRTVHPGGGIPMSIASAMYVDHHIARHYSLGNK